MRTLNGGPVDSEEFTSDANLFRDTDQSSTIVVEHGNTGTGTDGTDEAGLDGVALNDYSEDEDTDGDDEIPEETAAGSVAKEMGVDESAPVDEMDVDEGASTDNPTSDVGERASANDPTSNVDRGMLTNEMNVDLVIETSRPPRKEHEVAALFRAGCAWVRRDWSCAYDTVFMVFFAIYWQSPAGWRADWRKQSPTWTIQLADHFNLLIGALDSPRYSPEKLSGLFSSFRDEFRSRLSNHDPQRFPCQGQVSASACAILELLFGSIYGPGIEECLVCVECGATSQALHHFPLLALPVFRRNYRRKEDPRFIPSATLLARFIKSLAIPPGSSPCATCLHNATPE
jgi:hypothetical protein